MKLVNWFNRVKGQFDEVRDGVSAIPPQARTLVYMGEFLAKIEEMVRNGEEMGKFDAKMCV